MEIKLDQHSQEILDEYKKNLTSFKKEEKVLLKKLRALLTETGVNVAALESRVKTESSLAGKLELKGSKYASLADITDIIGMRVITFYIDDVDKVATAVERLFNVDWANSVDKRRIHEIDSFGYQSLHYVCSVPDFPYRFEIQMRTVLQHAWANMNHDTGYKSGVEIPKRYMRSMSRIAGILELVDEEFSKMRTELTDYRRRVQALVASGNLDEVPLDGDTFRTYLTLKPFANLNRRIASMNQAEIQDVPLMPYLSVFKALGCNTLGDISKMIKEHSEGAYQIACYQMGLTDLDIVSSSVGPQNVCIAYVLKSGGGRGVLKYIFDILNGESEANGSLAEFLESQAKEMPFMNQ
ncbi:MAG: hypothetical protein IJL91_04070 [Bacteroidales bacterium]|nr:hypothetical protein [Bacteroidales bacterium]